MRRRLLAFCLALAASTGAGCFDFDALSGGGERPDEGTPADLSGADLICLGTALVENCSDGVDNDGDCAADCDDTECAAEDVCKRIDGLVAYGEFTRGAGVCGTGSTVSGPANLYDKIDASQKACTGCACDAPTACTSELRLYSNKMCKAMDLYGTGGKVALPGATQCNALNAAVSAAGSVVFDQPTLKCAPNGTAALPAQPAWSGIGRLCLKDTAPKTCTTLSCVSSARATCLLQTGATCPAGYQKRQETWYQTYKEGRTCQCSCGSPTGQCEGTGTLHSNNTCTSADPMKAALMAGECKDVPGGVQAVGFDYAVRPKAGATCPPSGTTQGAATLEGALTLCCAQ